ncbi:MAG: ANTAR domain-containing protein [Bryobacteraceae bacterium]|nr:ANTAR domain-containing protein [Bryobacteraceae bacterium]
METLSLEANLQSHVALFHNVSRIVSSKPELDQILAELIQLAIQVSGCDACLVYLFEPGTGEVVLRASQLPHEREIGNIRLRLGEGVTGWVADHKSVVALSGNAYQDPRFKRFPALDEDNYEAFLSVPLITVGDFIGVLNVHHKDPHRHTPEEIGCLTFLGEQLGIAIARCRMAEDIARLKAHAEELKGQLETRKLVERAKGILQRTRNLTEEQAYVVLRNESRRMRRPMKELAQAIILAEEVSRLSGNGSSPGLPVGAGAEED